MKTTALIKLAASTIILGVTMVGCSPSTQGSHVANASDSKIGKVSMKAALAGTKALAAKDYAGAVTYAETAVGAMPHDAGYRMLLGQAYLGAGRFSSAETAFSEVLTLMPGDQRAALKLALVQIALGKNNAALTTLGQYQDKIGASDYGLALALAGDTDGGVKALEAAIVVNSDAKTRQNLALAYALAGKWTNAHVMAMQDMSSADADSRIMEWSKFTHPVGASDQVAILLGVQPITDAGQPTRLALAPSADDASKIALAAPVAMPTVQPAPIVTALAESAPVAAFETAPSSAVQRVRRDAGPVPAIVTYVPPAAVKQTVIPVHRETSNRIARPPLQVESGKFVVQLGAFENVAVSRTAWSRAASRFKLKNFEPANSTAVVKGANFVRLSVGGFEIRGEATLVCTRIKAAGGNCFVRGLLGDRPANWVQRGTPKTIRTASR